MFKKLKKQTKFVFIKHNNLYIVRRKKTFNSNFNIKLMSKVKATSKIWKTVN